MERAPGSRLDGTEEQLDPMLDNLSRPGDICYQSWKLCKIAPNCACFWSQKF